MARTMTRQTKFVLDEEHIPRSWYNIAADLPTPPPPVLHPGTGEPIGPGDLAHFDLSAYERHLSGALEDYEYPAERVAEALAALPGVSN